MAERQQDMLNALPVGEHCRCRHNVALATPERIIQGTAMAQIKQALVPDIGDYSDVPVIELLVQVGDRVSKDQGLATLRSEEHTSELQSLMRISYAVFCLKKKTKSNEIPNNTQT